MNMCKWCVPKLQHTVFLFSLSTPDCEAAATAAAAAAAPENERFDFLQFVLYGKSRKIDHFTEMTFSTQPPRNRAN